MSEQIEKKKLFLVEALKEILFSALVVSGPFGCGKTHAVYNACKELSYELVEIDKIEEYRDKRLKKEMIYLLRVTEPDRIKDRPYKGIIFETEDMYFYRRVKGAMHIKMNYPAQKALKEAFGVSKRKVNMHRASFIADKSENTKDVLLEGSEDPITLFHLLGKILYKKEKIPSQEVISLIERIHPQKLLMYLHMNVIDFSSDLSGYACVLNAFSLCAAEGYSRHSVFFLLSALWKMPRACPKTFYQFKSSSFYNM
ncbi:hypothetical protein NEFER03_1077 [Nematocida sp. LUAm3]|nr:hypothetical protein NEFER03_1077 [Nematocida sp. LUAm3]KAI5175318.1 hypothetical protein NEFER02_1247 [Nematocida sp. LUAm2]KAI5177725.1 hypothetical protein NEFER01_0949 [Nematocida sp. LUAm1]